jgi:uncharacterized protein DUF1585/uncharacterized protein DUF1588
MGEQQCAKCHGLMDPIGFALEHFDGIGAYRDKDEGLTIDPSGSVPDLGEFANAADLATLVRDDARSTQCMVRHLYRHAMGHLETKGEVPALAALDKAFESSGYRIQRALVEICSSEAFRIVGEPK